MHIYIQHSCTHTCMHTIYTCILTVYYASIQDHSLTYRVVNAELPVIPLHFTSCYLQSSVCHHDNCWLCQACKVHVHAHICSLITCDDACVCVNDDDDVDVHLCINTTANCVPMDEGMFRCHPYQRVFQYIYRHIAKMNLDQFTYQPCFVVRHKSDFLEIVLR